MLTVDAAVSAHTLRGTIVHSQWMYMEDQPDVIHNTTAMLARKKRTPDLSEIEKFKKVGAELERVSIRVSTMWTTASHTVVRMPSSEVRDRMHLAILRNKFTLMPGGGAKAWPSEMKD